MGKDNPRMSAQTLKVLAAFLSSQQKELAGSQIALTVRVASGSLYPILIRLEQAKWLESRWEEEEPSAMGRPRRRLYKMTALGARKATEELREVQSVIGGLAWQ
jgi:PadR family transcriptional regulator PadR